MNDSRYGWIFVWASLLVLLGCSDSQEDPAGASSGPSEAAAQSTSALAADDIVFHNADSSTGWAASGNSIGTALSRQEGAASIVSSGSGAERFRHNGLGPVDVRNKKYLTFWYYVDDASKIQRNNDAQVEIASSSSLDTQEMNWVFHDQHVQSGWNFIRLELPGRLRSKSGTPINLAAVKRFRLYHFVSGSVTTFIDDIRFTNVPDNAVNSGCAFVAANATIQKFGDTRSGTSYGVAGCEKSYVVDLKAYGPPNQTGTVVAYSGPNTTDQAVCESTRVSVYVYRTRNGPNSGWVPVPDRRGALGRVARGRILNPGTSTQTCQRPFLILDRDFPRFLPGDDYRVVVRSDRVVSGVRQFGETTLATPQPSTTPSSGAARMRRLAGSSAAMTAMIQQARGVSPDSRALACRAGQLDLVVLSQAAQALSAFGVSSSTITSYLGAKRLVLDTFCGSSFGTSAFDAQFRTAVLDLANKHGSLLNQLATSFGVDPDVAGGLVQQLFGTIVSDMATSCAPRHDVLAGLVFGRVSPGSSLQQSLEQNFFVTCTANNAGASARTRAGQIGNRLGNGFRQCIETVIDKEFGDPCSDPRANVERPVPAEVAEDCAKRNSEPQQDNCISAWQRAQLERELQEELNEEVDADVEEDPCLVHAGAAYGICIDAQRYLDSANAPTAWEIQRYRTEGKDGTSVWADIAWFIIGLFWDAAPAYEFAFAGNSGAATSLAKIQERELRRACEIVDNNHEKCEGLEKLNENNNKRCVGESPGDTAVTYPTDDGSPGKGAKNVFDAMQACWCDHISGPLTGNMNCLSAEEREREACLRNPWGPTDAPRPECLKHMSEGTGLSQDALLALLCWHLQPNCNGEGFIEANSSCGCAPVGTNPSAGPNCPAPLNLDCGPDAVFDQRSCGCLPFHGGAPWGNNPVCLNAPANSPGIRDAFITKNPNDLIRNRLYNIEQRPTADFLMVRGGGFVPVVTSGLFTRAFAQMGREFKVEIKMPDAVGPSGYRGAIKLACTSERTNNRVVLQRELQDLPLGRIATLTFPLTQDDMTACTSSDKSWRFELGVNSDPQTKHRLGISKMFWGGTAVPVTSPLPTCPAPEPGPSPVTLRPFSLAPEYFDADPIAVPPTWRFTNGETVILR
jgi:hypothetical protein